MQGIAKTPMGQDIDFAGNNENRHLVMRFARELQHGTTFSFTVIPWCGICTFDYKTRFEASSAVSFRPLRSVEYNAKARAARRSGA
jgi:hypothetical protein